MPFNKGDFTQQGVAGHVNANLRLNEKRLVNIDLTSDEDAEGCTIAGTVTDLLNDKVYGIGAGVSGNIEITENGENINVAPYATATVNVAGGGGGLPTLKANIINSTGDAVLAPTTLTYVKGEYGIDSLYITEENEEIEMFYSSTPVGSIVSFGDLQTETNQDPVTPIFTDLVNCQINPMNTGLIVTDQSLSSSATIILTTES